MAAGQLVVAQAGALVAEDQGDASRPRRGLGGEGLRIRPTVDLSGYPDPVVIYLGMRG